MYKEQKKRIIEHADSHLREVIEDFVSMELDKNGNNYHGECPLCGNRTKFTFNSTKNIYKCWSCQELGGASAVKFLMQVKGWDYGRCIEFLGNKFNFIPEDTKPAKQVKANKKTYCQRMLEEIGLTSADVEASVYKTGDNKSVFKLKTFRSGTIDDKGKLTDGDDVVIEYYDLDGYPILYDRKDFKRKATGERAEYFRIRWQYPEAHLDKEGKSFKYKSPFGSGTPIYIPQRLRTLYQKKETIERLYIQEGEKKAEKACKHGIPSIAVSGIQNLGLNGALPEDLVRIIRDCQVKEVVFMMDSDWDDLSSEIKLNVPVEKRPRCFFFAARNFKEYMRSLRNQDLYVEIYIGHVIKHNTDKGIDDLLAHTLKGKEEDLKKDLDHLINEKNLTGQYAQLFKITTWSDHKLEEIWGLESATSFANRHKDVLSDLPEFTFGRHSWKFDGKDQLSLAQPFDDDEKFWNEETKYNRAGTEYTEITYSYVNAKNFLQNRGFGRYRLPNGTFTYIQLDHPFVFNIQSTDVRDYILTFAENNCKKEINEMLLKGVTQYVGPEKLSILKFIEPNFLNPERDCQFFYFRDRCWKVMQHHVEDFGYESITHHLWKDRKRDFPSRYVGRPLISFTKKEDGTYTYTLTKEGKSCQFLQFLINASNFTWRKEATGDEITDDERDENVQHLLSKLCAIGFLSMDAKDPNVSRAVIAMDGKQSEVGESNGRSGKSLIGELMRQITVIDYINGKKKDLMDDQFIWNEVTEKTKVVFIDDVLQNFNFEFLFPCITGDWVVNVKGGQRFTMPFQSSPKIYIPTNHTIRGSGSSFTDRQWLIAFSDFYNAEHKPSDDFGTLFFSEWDFEQWNLTWNMIATCIQLYLQFGVVQAPGERIEQRKLRQEITEGFIMWADEYFSDPSRKNIRIARKDLQDVYFESDPQQRRFVSPNEFKKRFKKYCEFSGYTFNPQLYDKSTGQPYKFDTDGKPILDDKSGGVEYFTVGDVNVDDSHLDEVKPFEEPDKEDNLLKF